MLRIETPDTAKADVSGESPDPTSASPDVDLKAHDVVGKPSVTAEAPPTSDALAASAERSSDTAGQPEPAPVDSPAPSVVAVTPTPAIEKQENGTTDPANADSNNSNSENAAPEVRADQTEVVEAKPEKAETADVAAAEVTASVPRPSESKLASLSNPAETTAEVKGHGVKLPTVKVHATKVSKPAAKKAKRSGIYAMAQRRRAAARARAIARERAARLAQQKFVAVDPFAALFGVQQQPQIVQPPQQQP